VGVLLHVFRSWDGVAYWSGLVPHSVLESSRVRKKLEGDKRRARQSLLADKEAEYEDWMESAPYMDATGVSVKPTYDAWSHTWQNKRVVSIR
jgi:hypothetical protein